MKIAALIFLILIAIAIGVIILCPLNAEDNKHQQLVDVLTIIAMTIGITICITEIVNTVYPEELRYSSKEYRIETEVTTRGEQSDTTFIIIKK